MDDGDEFENPTFDEDEYDDDIDDRLPMVPNETDQRILLNQSGAIDNFRGEPRKTAVEAQKNVVVVALLFYVHGKLLRVNQYFVHILSPVTDN